MPITKHIVNAPSADTRAQYQAVWDDLDALGAHHPAGRLSHTAWLVGDQLHVLDVWDSEESFATFLETLGPLLDEVGLDLAGPPEEGELLHIVVPG